MGELAVGLPIFYFYLVKTFKNCDPLSLLFRQKNILKAKKKISLISLASLNLALFSHFSYLKLGNHSFGQL